MQIVGMLGRHSTLKGPVCQWIIFSSNAFIGGIMRLFAFAVVAGIFGAIGYKVADAVLFKGRK